MRPLYCVITAFAIACVGCAPEAKPHPSPTDAFYFPTGLAHAPFSNETGGILVVASSNFDKRFDRGSLTVVHLDNLPDLPALGATAAALQANQGKPIQVTDLHLDSSSQVEIQSLAGEVAVNAARLDGPIFYVPSRDEGAALQFAVVDSSGMHCPYADPAAKDPRDCFSKAPSLIANEHTETGLPRAPTPYGAAVADGELWVTHLQSADKPAGSGKEQHAYLVKAAADLPEITNDSFLPIGENTANSIALTKRWAFITARFLSATNGGQLLRLVQRDNPTNIVNVGLEGQFYSLESRGIAVQPGATEDTARVFVVGRSPDALLVADVDGLTGGLPAAHVTRVLPLSLQPNEVKLVDRPGRDPLAVITCTGAGIVAIYDDEVGKIVAQVPGVGHQPYSLAIDNRPSANAARIFATDFGDGRVAVIDIDDVGQPYNARLVAHLGKAQTCITNAKDSSCSQVAP